MVRGRTKSAIDQLLAENDYIRIAPPWLLFPPGILLRCCLVPGALESHCLWEEFTTSCGVCKLGCVDSRALWVLNWDGPVEMTQPPHSGGAASTAAVKRYRTRLAPEETTVVPAE